MAGLSYLVRRGGVLHFRATVPPDCRSKIGRRELRVSLGTGRMREARGKAFALAAFVRALMDDLRTGLMADLTSEEIFELTRREFRRILDNDRRARMQHPGTYDFGVRLPSTGLPEEDWLDISGLDPWEYTSARRADEVIRGKINEQRWPDLKRPVLEMLKRFGIEVSAEDPVINEVCLQYARGFVESMSAIKIREHGHIDYTPDVFLAEEQPPSPAPQETMESRLQPPKRMLSDLIRVYSEEKKQHGWTKRSERTISERLNYLIELMGDIELASIDHDFAFEFRKMLLAKPKKRQPAQARKTGKLESLAPGTVNNITTDISAMFKYAKKRAWIAENYFAEMSVRDTTPAHKKKAKFTKEELALVFGPGFVEACKDIPWRFWVPILGLFTGARLDEIAQARVDDVREIDGVWCLVVEAADGKPVKTLSGDRRVPLHPFLIQDLKFLAFIEQMRASNEVELFPGLKRIQGRKGHYMTKWFGEYRDGLGIAKTRTFHSLRKNFSNNLAIHDVPIGMIKRLDGHSLASDVTEHHYIQDIPVTKLEVYIKRLDFGVNLSPLAGSRFVPRD